MKVIFTDFKVKDTTIQNELLRVEGSLPPA